MAFPDATGCCTIVPSFSLGHRCWANLVPRCEGGRKPQGKRIGRSLWHREKTVSPPPPPATEDGSAGHGRMDGRADGLASETATEKDDDGANHGASSKRLLERRSAVRRENPRAVVVLFPTSELRGWRLSPKIRSQSVFFPWPEGEEDLLGISSKLFLEDAPATFAQDVLLRRGWERGQGQG